MRLDRSEVFDSLRRQDDREGHSGQIIARIVEASNHVCAGLRLDRPHDRNAQLDSAAASIHALPGVVEAAGGRSPVMINGGFRRGVNVIMALALGARAVLIGRPHLWGVACAGEEGVAWLLELYRREIDRALALGGWDGLAKLDPSIFFR